MSIGGMWGSRMTERESGWKESVDGVVSDFGEVTQHLRRRQQQALRVAWSFVAACAAAMVGLIVINLPAGVPSAAGERSPELALLNPETVPSGSLPTPAPVPNIGDAQPPAQLSPPPADVPSTPRRTLAVHTHTTPVTGSPAPVTTAPVTVAVPPAAAPPDTTTQAGLVDGLVKGVLHLLS
ncbi:MAG TPA: hypothetical protein VH134_04345 [Candidatus Dormibacteraeota bacterium]|nr:hypothetical protein [Candidatus Dormibacteraeota bacterium]